MKTPFLRDSNAFPYSFLPKKATWMFYKLNRLTYNGWLVGLTIGEGALNYQ